MTSRTRTDLLETIRTRVRAAAADYPVLTCAADDLDACAPSALEAFRRMQDARAGLPGAQAYDAPSVSGGGASLTQPERLADQTDPTEAERRLLDLTLRALDQATGPVGVIIDPVEWRKLVTSLAYELRRLIDRWTPHAPTDAQRRKVRDANTKATECALTREHLNLWDQVHCTSNLTGLIPEPVPVSRWVWRFTRDHKRLPTPNEWKHHASKDDQLRAQLIGSVK